MKRLFVIIVALFVGFAYAANETVVTSKKFVDDALAQKQPKFDGLGNDKLMLYSNTTDGVVASRDIVTTLGNSTSDTSVPTVGAINAGLNTKQDILNGDAGWVAENTGIAGAVVQKPVYSATNNYGNALVEVETLNNAVINAVNSELTVVPGVGWTINTADNLNLLSVPKTYNPYLPDGYTQLEYLKSTGTQYILTDIPWSSVKRFRGKAQETAILDIYNKAVLGSSPSTSVSSGYNRMYGTFYHSNTGIAEWYWDTNISPLVAASFDIAKAPADYVWMGTVNNLQTSGALDSESNVVLMSSYNTNFTRRAFNGSVWYIQLFGENGNMIFNGIPARRDSDGEIGMYDTVNNTFFTNDGTGEFIAGPDVHF